MPRFVGTGRHRPRATHTNGDQTPDGLMGVLNPSGPAARLVLSLSISLDRRNPDRSEGTLPLPLPKFDGPDPRLRDPAVPTLEERKDL